MLSFFKRKRVTPIRRPWFGPLSLAQPEVLQVLQGIPSYQALVLRGLSPEKTLLLVPEPNAAFPADVFVLGQMFAWDAQSPVVWLFSTVGLCQFAQPSRADRQAFRRFELVLGTRPSIVGPNDPFPARLGVVLMAEGGTLPGWDWSQVVPPPLMRWVARAGQEVFSQLQAGAHFAIPDTLTYGPGGSSWTLSILNHSILLPASVHMLLSGLVPFNQPSDPGDAIPPGQWHAQPGTDRFEYGFYWLLPVSEAEHEKAQREGSWNVFADLVERAPAGANDDCYATFDLLRDRPG